jgi:ferredoxin
MEAKIMNVMVKKDKCIGCGSCVALTDSQVFDFDDDGQAQVVCDDIKEDMINKVKDAIKYCPTDAISEVNDNE